MHSTYQTPKLVPFQTTGLCNTEPCCARESQVPDQLQQLQKAVESLIVNVTELSQRLNPVRHPSVPSQDCCEKSPDDNIAPLAQAIRTLYRRVQQANTGLSEISATLEL